MLAAMEVLIKPTLVLLVVVEEDMVVQVVMPLQERVEMVELVVLIPVVF
jgi:hypothetical protein